VPILAIGVGLLSLAPFLYLFLAGFSYESIRKLFAYPTTWPDIRRTVGLALAVSAASVAIGISAAMLVIRTDVPFRKFLTVLFALPLAIPSFVSAYAIYSANLVFNPHSDFITSFLGAVAVLTLSLYPYVFLACVIAVRNLDPAQEEAARSLSHHPFRVFWKVSFPQLRPALAGSIMIVVLHVLSDYGTMVQLRQRTLTTTIMAEMIDYGDYTSARSLSLLLVVLTLGFLVLGRLFSGRPIPLSVASQTVRPPNKIRLQRARIPVFLAALIVPLAGVAPTFYMTFRGLNSPRQAIVVNWSQVFASAGTTLNYALWAGLVTTAMALPVSWWLNRKPSMFSHLTERSVWLAHSIPNAVLALSLVFLATRLVPSFYKTPTLLILAYVIMFLPLAVSNQGVGLQAAAPKFEEAAAALGSNSWERFRRVSLPIAFPGIATGALLVGLDASKELTSTLMLLPFNVQTLATGLWGTTNGESLDFTAAAPYALMLVILGSIPVYFIARRTVRYID